MTSGQAHVPSEWSREAMASAPYQVTTYEAAPVNYPAVPEVAPAPAQYVPQAQYQTATYGDRAPLVPYQNQNYAPAQAPNVLAQPEQKNRNIFKTVMIGGAAVVATGVAAGVIGLGLHLNKVDDAIDSTPNDGADRNSSAPVVAGHEIKGTLSLDQATPIEFFDDANFTDQERVDWAWNQLDQPTKEAGYEGMTRIQAANAKLRERNPFATELVEPSIDMPTDNVLMNESSVYFLAATTRELSDDDRSKILAAVLDNSSESFHIVERNILERNLENISGIEEVDTSSINNLPVESPIFRHTVLNNGFDPKGIDTKVVNVHLKNTTEGKKQKYYQFIDGKPIQIQQIDSTDASKRASNPQNIPAY